MADSLLLSARETTGATAMPQVPSMSAPAGLSAAQMRAMGLGGGAVAGGADGLTLSSLAEAAGGSMPNLQALLGTGAAVPAMQPDAQLEQVFALMLAVEALLILFAAQVMAGDEKAAQSTLEQLGQVQKQYNEQPGGGAGNKVSFGAPKRPRPHGSGGARAASDVGEASNGKLETKSSPNIPTVTRQGKPIGAHIAGAFDRMVDDAKKDGVNLTVVSGYRSRAEQVTLWNKYGQNPARVARPGTSNHEFGNAIDFGNTPGAYAWLKKNASKYGLHNYDPEPWHYSTNGR